MTHGMVVAPQPEAAEAGALVLDGGGNAVDAAIAAALVQTVVDPLMCGIAGFGVMHVRLPDGSHTCIDFHGRAPLAATEDMWADKLVAETEDGFGFILENYVNDIGYGSITAPGSLLAFAEALAQFGTVKLEDLLDEPIRYADEGFLVRPHVAHYWNLTEPEGRVPHIQRLSRLPATAAIYLANGKPRVAGDVHRNADMAKTLGRIQADGVASFYHGDIADEIATDMGKHGAMLTKTDLTEYRTVTNEPLRGAYRGYEVVTNQLPGGGAMVVEMLSILEQFDVAGMGHNSADYLSLLAEVMKIATVDKDRYMGDPRFVDVPLTRLFSAEYASQCGQRIRSGEKVHVPRVNRIDSKDTTHVCTVDELGCCVTMTHSLGNPSGVVTGGLGFMYNGCMNVFDPRPGNADSIQPGKSRFTAMSPTIVNRSDGSPYLVIGAPGGTYITMGVLQGILNVIDFGMTALEAVSAPRICVTSDTVDLTNRIPRFIESDLIERGYKTRRSHLSYHFAGVHAIRLTDEGWDGGADPGRDGMALGV